MHSDLSTSLSLKKNLVHAYRIMGYWQWSDLTYTHMSCRTPEKDRFNIQPFGLLYQEVTEENLLEVDLNGHVLKGEEYQYNKTGYTIHSHIYATRPDISCIMHLHIPEVVAISCLPPEEAQYKLQLPDWIQEKISYHRYNSLSLNSSQGEELAQDLGNNWIVFMPNHGIVTCGESVSDAFFYMYYIVRRCYEQCYLT